MLSTPSNGSSIDPRFGDLTAVWPAGPVKTRGRERSGTSILNMARDWLKHGGAAEMTIDRASAAFMVARAISKLENWTPKMEEFKIWLVANPDDL